MFCILISKVISGLCTVRIGFERCTCILQLLICVAGPGYLLLSQDAVFLMSLSMGISEEIEDAKITAEKTKISRLKRRSENLPKFALSI